MKAHLLLISVLGGAGAFSLNAGNVTPIVNPPVRVSGLDAHDGSAAASLLGQFRTNISAWLWVHTDLYLHNGVHMRPITDAERKAGIQIEGPRADSVIYKEVSITLVPSPERDYRGIVGDVDRAVNAWKPMKNHTHNDPMQTLPLFRLMTWLDPQFIDGWTTGASVLARDRSPAGTAKAMKLLNEGLAQNPDSVDILTEIAYLDITRKNDLNGAIPLLEHARELGFSHLGTIADNERDALENTYHWLALCYRDTNRPLDERRVAAQGIGAFPDDKVLPHLLAGTAPGDSAKEADSMRVGGE
ncbi:MAG TPA: hypothetical protein VMI31_03615 [Fimbriimonadaceae bacterium]|nr:hypothetical protein [Fimbriimonadaceae bacterium]